jgi:hypothetical protein
MKTFSQYLTESERTYSYRIKIVGDVDSDFEKEFRNQLKKFDTVSIKDTKKTPILSQPSDFPGHTNQAVNIIDVELRYPATPPQIEQMASLLGLEKDRISMNNLQWSEGMDQELLGIEQQTAPLLGAEYPANNAEQKEASEEYSAVGPDKAVVKNSAEGAVWTVAGGTTPPAATTNHLAMGVKSPMTDVKRPAKPAVGRKI